MDHFIPVTTFLIIALLLDIIATIRPSRQTEFNRLVGMVALVVMLAIVIIKEISRRLS